MRGQKKRAPPSAADRAAARSEGYRVRDRAPGRQMRLPPLCAQLDAWGKIIEQIGLQPE
jgi:hypothetical protein